LRHAIGRLRSSREPTARRRRVGIARGEGVRERAPRTSAGSSARVPLRRVSLPRHEALKVRLGALPCLQGLDLVNALWPTVDEDTRTILLAAQTIATTTPEPAEILATLREVITQPELPGSEGDIIRVMSLHKSKGLTAALVVVVGCIWRRDPDPRSRPAPAGTRCAAP
jgi:hypothetical protein